MDRKECRIYVDVNIMKNKEDWKDAATELSTAYETDRERYEAANDEWWNTLSKDEREHAFYAVVKRIHKGELIDKGSYRYVLYDNFGFDQSMYMRGMDCGFMDLHNAIEPDE